MSSTRSPCFYVCTTCTGSVEAGARSAAEYDASGEPRPGSVLFQALKTQAEQRPDSITIEPVVCLGNCEQGCSVAIAEPGKWGYLLGGMRPELAPDLLTYGSAYQTSKSGTVMRSKRPESLRHAIMSRFPVPGDDGDDAFLQRTVSDAS